MAIEDSFRDELQALIQKYRDLLMTEDVMLEIIDDVTEDELLT